MKLSFLLHGVLCGILVAGCGLAYGKRLVQVDLTSRGVEVDANGLRRDITGNEFQGDRDVLSVKIDKNVSCGQIWNFYSYLYTNNVAKPIDSFIRLRNGREAYLRYGCIENYFPGAFLLGGQTKKEKFALKGNAFVRVDEQTAMDDRLFCLFWDNLQAEVTRKERIPSADKNKINCFEVFCELDVTYGEIEECLIEANELGYEALFIVGVRK